MVYMVEVINRVQAISLNYGTITRDSPVRSELLVFCFWNKNEPLREVFGVGFPKMLKRTIKAMSYKFSKC